MEEQNIVLFEIRNIIRKTITNIEDVKAEIDFEVGFRKWIAQHKDAVLLILSVVFLIVAVFR